MVLWVIGIYILLGVIVIGILAVMSEIGFKNSLSCVKLVPVWPIVLWIVILMKNWRLW
jgi:hypothetical protein